MSAPFATQEFEARFCLLDGGAEELMHLLEMLKSRGFALMMLENVEEFEENIRRNHAMHACLF